MREVQRRLLLNTLANPLVKLFLGNAKTLRAFESGVRLLHSMGVPEKKSTKKHDCKRPYVGVHSVKAHADVGTGFASCFLCTTCIQLASLIVTCYGLGRC